MSPSFVNDMDYLNNVGKIFSEKYFLVAGIIAE